MAGEGVIQDKSQHEKVFPQTYTDYWKSKHSSQSWNVSCPKLDDATSGILIISANHEMDHILEKN